MTHAWAATRGLGLLLVALLIALGPNVGPAAAGAATAASNATATNTTESPDADQDSCAGNGRTSCHNHMLVLRSAPGVPAPRAAGGYPGTGAATADRPVPAPAARSSDHNRRLAVLQVFRW